MAEAEVDPANVDHEAAIPTWVEQLECFSHPDLWPHRPLLPVVRGDLDDSDAILEYGVVVEGEGAGVYICNLLEGLAALQEPDWRTTWLSQLTLESHESWEAVLNAGWIID